MFQENLQKKKILNDETEADRYSPKDAGEGSLKDVQKKIYISRRKTTNYWWIKVSITIW